LIPLSLFLKRVATLGEGALPAHRFIIAFTLPRKLVMLPRENMPVRLGPSCLFSTTTLRDAAIFFVFCQFSGLKPWWIKVYAIPLPSAEVFLHRTSPFGSSIDLGLDFFYSVPFYGANGFNRLPASPQCNIWRAISFLLFPPSPTTQIFPSKSPSFLMFLFLFAARCFEFHLNLKKGSIPSNLEMVHSRDCPLPFPS